MARRPRTPKIPGRRPGRHLRAQTRGMRLVNRCAFLVLVGTACVAVAALSLPQVRELRRLKEELTRTEARERHVLQQKDHKSRELAALRDDPSYLELIARDRLDLYRPGEQVLRIRRSGESPSP